MAKGHWKIITFDGEPIENKDFNQVSDRNEMYQFNKIIKVAPYTKTTGIWPFKKEVTVYPSNEIKGIFIVRKDQIKALEWIEDKLIKTVPDSIDRIRELSGISSTKKNLYKATEAIKTLSEILESEKELIDIESEDFKKLELLIKEIKEIQ